jgi:hypothetical protein
MHTSALAEALRVDVEKLNVDIFRARRQFLEAGVVDAHALIERRHHSRALRLGLQSFEICRGERPKGSSPRALSRARFFLGAPHTDALLASCSSSISLVSLVRGVSPSRPFKSRVRV